MPLVPQAVVHEPVEGHRAGKMIAAFPAEYIQGQRAIRIGNVAGLPTRAQEHPFWQFGPPENHGLPDRGPAQPLIARKCAEAEIPYGPAPIMAMSHPVIFCSCSK